MAIASDDFSGGTLGGVWSFAGPSGAGAALGAGGGEAWLELQVPNGDFNLYRTTKNAARLMQEAPDGDFQLEARFLSTPTVRNQMQGILVEEDVDSWIRFDTYFDGTRLRAFAAVTLNGTTSNRINVALPVDAAPYLRVVRSGDVWSFAWSADGVGWTTAGSFTQSLDVTAVGPFAGGLSSPYLARVDYFENLAAPIADEDGTIPEPPNRAPAAQEDALSATAGTPLTFTIASLLGNDSDADGDALVLAGFTQPAHGTLVDNGDGTLTYTPAAGFAGSDSFGYTVSDGTSSDGATVTLAVAAPAAAIASDDFSGPAFAGFWSFAGPSGAGAALGTGGGEAWLELQVPNGDFNLYRTTKNALRLMQDAPDGDFQLEARFLSTPTVKNQMQGILVQEDADSWIRFDTYFDGTRLRAFAAVTLNGTSTNKINVAIPGDFAPYLKVVRSGDVWSFAWSADGIGWTTAGSFTQGLDVTAVGPFAGGVSSPYTARVDYFENLARPIADEDGTVPDVPDLAIAASTPARLEGDSGTTSFTFTITRSGDGLGEETTVGWAVAGHGAAPANAADFAGGVLPGGQTTFLAGQTSKTVTVAVRGDAFPEWDEGFTVTLSNPLNGRIATGAAAATIRNDDGAPAVIDVWYGDTQSFGVPGQAQRWVNILGEVDPSQVTALACSLNGGAFRTLKLGSDTRRLQNPGDFNADIDIALLDGSTADDVLSLRATLAGGGMVTRTVVIDYQSGHRWAPDYAVDWAAVSDLQDVAQIVDGKWNVSTAGLRVAEPGYDRFVAIGDQHWDNYELNLAVTMHDLHSVDPRGRDGGIFGFGMNWTGHTDDPVAGWQPKAGWNPCELIIFKNTTSGGRFSFFGKSGTYPFQLQEGETYEFTLKVEQVGALAHRYSLKVWDADNPEPAGWLFSRTIDYTTPQTGSLMLLTHYYDVTFKDLEIDPIAGNDTVVATAAGGPLRGVGAGAANPGRGETDLLRGAAGADRFILGEDGAAFYDDGVQGAAGQGDYAVVWGSERGEDRIQLAGSAADYSLGPSPAGLPSGTAIWRETPGEADELIGIVASVTGLTLDGPDFVYDPLIA